VRVSHATVDSSGYRKLKADGTELLQNPGTGCCCVGVCGCAPNAVRDPENPPAPDDRATCDCNTYALDLPGVGTFTLKRAYGIGADYGDASGEPGALPGAKYSCCGWSNFPNLDVPPTEGCPTVAALSCDLYGNGLWGIDVNYLPCDEEAACRYQWQTDVYANEPPSTTFADWMQINVAPCNDGQTFTLACTSP
jgi:hypothetical protein